MPLLDILKASKDQILKLEIRQIVNLCGDGKLADGSECSSELRSFLKQTPSTKLFGYVEPCLTEGFEKSGYVLQDLVNELGRRLEYEVENGRYQGTPKAIGFDGIWRSPRGQTLVVEVKTTDAYRINLDTIASYRSRLIAEQQIPSSSSILLVVGRQDTGDLEAQVRGSRHAWDIRLISVDSLAKLVTLKEEAEDDTAAKIYELLTPFEYTRVDKIIDLTFTAAREVGDTLEQDAAVAGASPPEVSGTEQARTPRVEIDALRQRIVEAIEKREQAHLIRKSAALFWSADEQHTLRVACTLSKPYEGHEVGYWYAYHSKWDSFLSGATRSYLVLGCMDKERAFAVPLPWIRQRLPGLNRTERESDNYWHIYLGEDGQGVFFKVPNKEKIYLEEFAVILH